MTGDEPATSDRVRAVALATLMLLSVVAWVPLGASAAINGPDISYSNLSVTPTAISADTPDADGFPWLLVIFGLLAVAALAWFVYSRRDGD